MIKVPPSPHCDQFLKNAEFSVSWDLHTIYIYTYMYIYMHIYIHWFEVEVRVNYKIFVKFNRRQDFAFWEKHVSVKVYVKNKE